MKNKILQLVLVVLFIASSIILWVVLDATTNLYIVNTTGQIVYYTIKIFTLLTIIGTFIYSLKKREASNMYILVGFTAFIQVLPFIVRLLASVQYYSATKVIFALLITIFTVIGYLGLFILIHYSNTKIAEVMETLKGKSIEIVDESSYFDSEGKFVGSKGDKNE